LIEEYDNLRKRPAQVITKVERVVDRVEVIPHDYEELKINF
jgi:hypothetical protein